MTNPKGTRWETRLADFLRPLHPRVERRARSGKNDKGDLSGIDGWTIEAKACTRLELAKWMDEAEKEARNAGTARYAVVFPRRSCATAKAYAVMPLWMLAELMVPDETRDAVARTFRVDL